MLVGKPILPEKVLIVSHKEEPSGASMNLGIGGISAEAML